MGMKDAKQKVIQSLRDGKIQAEARADIKEKNLLMILEPECWFISVHKSHSAKGKEWSSTKKATNRKRSVSTAKK